MTQMLETVTADGLPPNMTVDFSASAQEAVRTCVLNCHISGDGLPCLPGQEVVLKASGDVILTGFVRDVVPSHSKEQRALKVTLCSKTIDAVECSCQHKTGEILNKDLGGIARELNSYGLGVEVDGSMPSFERHKLEAGEPLFSSVERRARSAGVLIFDTPKGKLKLASKPSGRHTGGLVRGINIEGGSATLTEEGQYSKIKVRGQRSKGTTAKEMRGEATATGTSTRNRLLIIRHDGDATQSEMKKRADWLSKRAAGQSLTATITVVGWRDDAGLIWQPNYLVPVQDGYLGLDGDMLIKTVHLIQNDRQGTIATLTLCDPRALGGENPRGKTSKVFNAPGRDTSSFDEED